MSDQNPTGTAVIVYESMFGNTRHIAEAIAEGIRPARAVHLVPIREVQSLPDDLEVLIVGGPTHVHGLSRPESRADAAKWAMNDSLELQLEPDFEGPGIREWLKEFEPQVAHHVAFDTRVDMPRMFTGSAAAAIDRRLTKLGSRRLAEPMSFLVDRDSHLEAGERDRARRWGAEIAESLAPAVTK
jgi:hypothetical protein